MVYYEMAKEAGITMMPSRLIQIEGKHHCLTERYDRINGEGTTPFRFPTGILNLKTEVMVYETNCTEITQDKWRCLLYTSYNRSCIRRK